MAIDSKIFIGIVICIAIIVGIILYFVFKKPKSPVQKEIEFELEKLKKAKDKVNQFLGLVIPTGVKCRPDTDPDFSSSYTTFGEIWERLKRLLNEKRDLIPQDLANKCDTALKDAETFNTYLRNLKSCKVFCENKGTATLTSPRECTCNRGYTNPKEVNDFIECQPTQATTQVTTELGNYNTSETKLSDFFKNFKMTTLPSTGCINWAGGYDTEEKRNKANNLC